MSQTRKLAAILAADVVGFSRLAGADEDRTLACGLRQEPSDGMKASAARGADSPTFCGRERRNRFSRAPCVGF
jgi:hypothetical protein